MLIRSQNKEMIINLDRIIVLAKHKDNSIVVVDSPMSYPGTVLSIGKYSTEEKALKVLDMIEAEYRKYLNVIGGPSLMRGGMDVQPAVYNIPKTFQMPTDKELDEPTSQTIINDINKMYDELAKEAPNAKV